MKLRWYTEYVIVVKDTGECIRKIKKILYDKYLYKEIERTEKRKIINNNNEKYGIKEITIIVEEHKQLRIEWRN